MSNAVCKFLHDRLKELEYDILCERNVVVKKLKQDTYNMNRYILQRMLDVKKAKKLRAPENHECEEI